MSAVQSEIAALEERLRLAELGPDPDFFEETLANDLMLSQDGQALFTKAQIVEAHRPGKGPKFTRVEMSDTKIVDHGIAAVVTCQGVYEGPGMSATLKFMRVWLKKDSRWQIIAASVASVPTK